MDSGNNSSGRDGLPGKSVTGIKATGGGKIMRRMVAVANATEAAESTYCCTALVTRVVVTTKVTGELLLPNALY